MLYYVNHTAQFPHNTGIQRCVRLIARSLMDNGIPLTPVCWNSTGDFEDPSSEMLMHLHQWSGPSPSQWTKHFDCSHSLKWLIIVELVSGPYAPSADQLHEAAAKRGLKVAWLFHDAIPIRYQHLYGDHAAHAASCHRVYMQGLGKADLVLANSKTSQGHLKDFLFQHQQRSNHVHALPLAEAFPDCPRLQPTACPASSEPWHLLCVSSLEPRKNHVSLLKAFTWLYVHGFTHAELCLVGWPNDQRVVALVKRALSLGLPIQWKGAVSDTDLRSWYQWAHLTVFPSIEEGFGLPVAESLWHGRPCICSGDGALGELASKGGCYRLDGSGWRQLLQVMRRLLTCESDYAKLQKQAQIRQMTSWEDYANEFVNFLKKEHNNCHSSPTH